MFKRISITSPHGGTTSGMYMYDFRSQHQDGGLYHFTLVSGVTHTLAWETGDYDIDTDSFGGEICELSDTDSFTLAQETLTNPVSFDFCGERTSLERLALMSCPAECMSNNEYRLIKANVECKSDSCYVLHWGREAREGFSFCTVRFRPHRRCMRSPKIHLKALIEIYQMHNVCHHPLGYLPIGAIQ